jgi:TatD DNase family protein
MSLFDSHCHLQDERCIGRIAEILARAGAAGVTHMLCCGTAPSDWRAVATLAAKHPQVVPAFGLHPWFIAERPSDWLATLENFLRTFPQAAVGEIGLDHAAEKPNDTDQADVFIAQLTLARKLGRPVSIHCRKAWGDMLRILTEQCGLPHGGAIHSFSGSPDLIPRLTALNVSLSFSGSIIYERNRKGRACAAAVPEPFLLIETDSPDIPPPGVAPGENEPATTTLVATALSALRGCPVERIGEETTGNARRLFVLPRLRGLSTSGEKV